MTVFFDHQTFSLQEYGGISRYITELIDRLNRTEHDHAALPLLFTNNTYARQRLGIQRPFLPRQSFHRKKSLLYRINKLYSVPYASSASYALYHATYYDPALLPFVGRRPVVVTFHDLIHERFAGQFPELAADRVITGHKKRMAERADGLIAVSERTKADLVALFNVPPDRIRVIYHGFQPMTETGAEPGSRENFLLYVGDRPHYKNFAPYLRAVAHLLKTHDLRLVCAGGGAFTPAEQALLRDLGLEDRVRQQPVDDRRLSELYRTARAFVFPSLYEGFGLPVLEAFSAGCPCLLSRDGSLPEVGGEAALYFDPTDPESMADTLEQFLRDESGAAVLAEQGTRQLARFSWETTFARTLDLYHQLT